MIKEKNILDAAALLAIIKQKDIRIEKLEHQLDQLLRTVYGKKSERFTSAVLPGQLPLALDVEVQEQEAQSI